MNSAYRPELDGLRALAIVAVMGFHFARPFASGGSLGVDVFFVLSGYLITSILLREREASSRIGYRAFISRRARRLLPALFLLLATYVALGPVLWPGFAGRRWLDAGTAAFYVTNLREAFWPAETPLSHTWSLAIEEQFYLAWPLAVTALARLDRRVAARLLLVGWAMITLARAIWLHAIPGPGAYYLTPLHASGLMLGSGLAYRRVEVGFGGAALATLLVIMVIGRSETTLAYTIPAAEILTALVIADAPRLLSAPPLTFLGRVSYGVYLWHVPLGWAIGFPATLGGIAAVFGLSIAAGAASHYSLERWFRMGRSARPGAATLTA